MPEQQDILRMIVTSEMALALRDMNHFNTNLDTMKKKSKDVGTGFGQLKNSVMGAVGAFLAVGASVWKAVDAQSNLNEMTNYWEETFRGAQGTAYKGIEQLTESYAMSRREAMQLTSEIGSLAKGMNFGTKEAATFSTEIVKMAADWGSFKNMRTEDVLTAIRSGLVGEAEPMRRFGADLRETALQAKALEMGLWKGKGALDAKTKALAAYNIMADVFAKTNAKGDMIRTAESWANQVKRFKANAEEFAASAGAQIIPALDLVLKRINESSSGSENWGTIIGALVGKIILSGQFIVEHTSIIFRSLEGMVYKFQESVSKAGSAVADVLGADELKKYFDDNLETAKIKNEKYEEIINKHKSNLDNIEYTWNKLGKERAQKSYKDDVNAISNVANQKKQMTAQEIEAMKKAKAEYYEYVGDNAKAIEMRELEKSKKIIETAKLSGEEQKKVEVAAQKKINDEIGKYITEKVTKITNGLSSALNVGKQIFDSFAAISNQQAKNNEIRLDQQNKFFEMQLENQRKLFETKYTEKYEALENEKMMEEESIKSQIMDESTRAALLESITKKYNDKKQALDNQRGSEEKKMLEEQQKLKEQMDARNMYLKHKEALRQREMAFTQAIIAAFLASVQAFSSAMWLPFPANLIVGGIVAAGTLATGLVLANAIKSQPIPWLAEGGIIKGTSQGTLVRAGEGGRAEAILPLESDKGKEILGGSGEKTTIILNVQNLYATEDVPRNMIIAIDKAYYKLKQDRASLALR